MAFQLGECLLRYQLRRNGMTPAEFARRMGCTRQFVDKLMNGTKTMSLEFAINAGELLNCDPKDFYVLKLVPDRSE